MRPTLSRGLVAATTTCALTAAAPAFAGGSGMPWEGPLQQVVESITGPVVQAAAVVAVVIFGAAIAMSESGGAMRRGLGILFGLSIAFAASSFFLDFFGYPRAALRAWAESQTTGLRRSAREPATARTCPPSMEPRHD
ncbi:MAG: conjugal transfer protein TrbC [Phenylobacterium sp.]|uniref:TrbC/VirB2 family protein n=1 Tax=Phenylobacterium sp. TaxID=1871053 RepID=UPI0025CE31BE|nr:TrbC/VirB2 family protein [Phenylobacterium sp.]MBI1196743.1 conjugal transfer protein TrbC [Phenylobacterium sp.]